MTDSQKPTVKQQRAAVRDAKVAEFRRAEAARKRNRRILIVGGIVAAVAGATVAVIAIVSVVAPGPKPAAELGTVETWKDLASTHTAADVDYRMSPPAGGPHNPAWLNCGVYSEPQHDENAVHSLEHGAVWVTYDPDRVSGSELDDLIAVTPTEYAVLSPYPGLDAPMAISAWGAQLKFDDPADPAVADFIDTYWRSADAPEPGASCSGAVEGPGRVG